MPLLPGGDLVSDIFSVEPVKPAIGQFYAIDVLNGALGRDLYRQGVDLPGQ